jgi:hypothetical protein
MPFEREQLLVIVRQVLAGRRQQKLPIMPWQQGLSTLLKPAIKNQLVVRTVDGTLKLIRDLIPGDVVPVERENGEQMLHLVERDGKLGQLSDKQFDMNTNDNSNDSLVPASPRALVRTGSRSLVIEDCAISIQAKTRCETISVWTISVSMTSVLTYLIWI